MAEHCRRCMVPRAGNYWTCEKRNCIRGEDLRPGQSMCSSMRADIAEAALMRLACPDAFEPSGKIIPARLFDAIDAKNRAMQSACKERGPTLVFENPAITKGDKS